ncbi:MAG: metal ABC transporter solute-binding protein, Zn/Mn family [Enterococcus sp.]
MKKIITGFLAIITLTVLAACGSTSATTDDKEEKITAVTTFYPMYEFTKAVLGDEGTVEMLIPAGSEPHDFEPSAKDMTKVTNSDLFVYNSSALEKWAKEAKSSVDTDKTTVVEAAKGIQLSQSSEEEGELDPHVWLDPVYAQQEVATIEKALIKKYPNKKEIFTKNAEAYSKQLKNLDEEYQTALQDAKQRSFVTQHAAFGYLAKRYDLTQEAISGLSPEEEPSAGRLAELKTYVKENQLSVIYFEENTTSKVAQTLADETGVDTAVLNPIEGIPTKDIENGTTYISIMEENLKSLQKTIQ